MSGGVDFCCICWQLSPALRIPGFCSVVLFLCKIHRATNKFMFTGSRFQVQVQSHTHKLNTFMSLALYLKIRNLFGIGESLCFALFYVQTLPILTNFYIHAKHKHTLPSFKFIVHQYWIRKKLEPSVCDSQYKQPISKETQCSSAQVLKYIPNF